MTQHNDPSDASTTSSGAEHLSDSATGDVPFGSNEIRLSIHQWIVALVVTSVLGWLVPVFWQTLEGFNPGPDYRVPYRLSNDYWMVKRYFRRVCQENKTLVLGDSVMWGHYVGKEATLSHHLNEAVGAQCFANLGVDGIHPAALSGLIEHYGTDIVDKNVVLNCNLLWMSSKRHDLQVEKEFSFNHPELVPQLSSFIPCYKESLSGRLGIIVRRNIPFLGWTKHLQIAYFDSTDLPMWTIEHPYDSPVGAVTLELPSPDEPPSPEPVAEPWYQKGIAKFNPQWVELDTSFQWARFLHTIEVLKRRDNRVFVLVGPFNEHMLAEESLEVYKRRKQEAGAWLKRSGIPHAVPPPLPSQHYADASHPLSPGYRMLAEWLLGDRLAAQAILREAP